MKILTDKNGKPILVDGKVICVDDVVQIKDVQIGDTSIFGEDGIGHIPVNERNKPSLFVIDNAKGINVRSDGTVGIGYASNQQIDSRGQIFCPIVPATIDYAVKVALCDGKGQAYTAEEQASARQRLGAASDGWEFLNYFVVESDTTEFTLTADNKGVPYNLRKVIVYVAPATGHNGYIYINADKSSVMSRVPIKNGTQPYCLYEAEANGVFAIQKSSYGMYNNNLTNYLYTIPFSKTTFIQELNFTVYNNVPIPSGTKITVYGIRA